MSMEMQTQLNDRWTSLEYQGGLPPARVPRIFLAFCGYAICMLLNCFMTANPYAAQHSGQAGFRAEIMVDSWWVSPVWFLLAVSLLAVAANKVRIQRDWLIPLAILLMCISGYLSEDIISKPQTYAFNTIMLVLSATMAAGDANAVFHVCWKNRLLMCLYLIMIFGLAMSWLRPATFGHFGDFTRERRGEVMIWTALAFRVFAPPLAIYGLLVAKHWPYKVLCILPWCACALSSVMTYSRANLAAELLGLSLLIWLRFRKGKVVLALIPAVGLPFCFAVIIDYMLLGNNWQDFLEASPRIMLWQCHLEAFLFSPTFGVGTSEVNELWNTSIGTSEIGMLAWFSWHGWLYGSVMVLIVVRGVVHGSKLLRHHARNGGHGSVLDLICPAIVFVCLARNMLESHARLMTFADFAYYYAIFYCFYRMRGVTLSKMRERAASISPTKNDPVPTG